MTHKPFHTSDGKTIHNIEQLADAIVKMDEKNFRHHVNSEKNDFSNWLDYIGEKDAAAKLRNSLTKEQTLKVLADTRPLNNTQYNMLMSDSLKDKINWYIRAHGHSSIGGLNLMLTYFDFYQKKEEATIIEKAIHLFENFSKGDLKMQLKSLSSTMQEVRCMVETSDISKAKKKEMEGILDGVENNITRIYKIIKNPEYEEKFKLTKILFSAVVQLTSQYPNILYGDLIGEKAEAKGDRIKLTVVEPQEEREILCCGYEMQLLFFNLLCNAVDAINDNGKGNIYVKVRNDNNDFCVDISDDGKLLSDEDVKKIMEHKEFSTKGNGHGSGLKIVSDILGKYKGNIDIKKDTSKGLMIFSLKIPQKN